MAHSCPLRADRIPIFHSSVIEVSQIMFEEKIFTTAKQ